MPEFNNEEMSATLAESSRHISDALADCLPPISGVNERTNIFDMTREELSTLNFDQLVDLRFAHQTKQALSGVRRSATGTFKAQTSENSAETSKKTQRQELLRRLNEIIKEQQEKGIGTGAERGLRWRNPAPGGRDGAVSGVNHPPATAGNTANAAENATKLAGKVWQASRAIQMIC
jgi:hypothetical protein